MNNITVKTILVIIAVVEVALLFIATHIVDKKLKQIENK